MATDVDQMQLVIESLYGILDDMVEQMTNGASGSAVAMSNVVIDDSALLHAEERRKYDPQKAHDYYMRTRKLIGRKVKDAVTTEHRVNGVLVRKSYPPGFGPDTIIKRPSNKQLGEPNSPPKRKMSPDMAESQRKVDKLMKSLTTDPDMIALRKRNQQAANRRKLTESFNKLKKSSQQEIDKARDSFNDGLSALKGLFS